MRRVEYYFKKINKTVRTYQEAEAIKKELGYAYEVKMVSVQDQEERTERNLCPFDVLSRPRTDAAVGIFCQQASSTNL